MKQCCLLFIVFAFSKAYSQNDFASPAFYNGVKKIIADAQETFPKYKGSKRPAMSFDFYEVYRVKLLLPMADSGRIVFPANANPYAEYYFPATKTKQDADQQAVNLREALLTIYEKPLYSRTETSVLKENISSNTYYYADSAYSTLVFSSEVYQEDKHKYYLIFRIIGNKQ